MKNAGDVKEVMRRLKVAFIVVLHGMVLKVSKLTYINNYLFEIFSGNQAGSTN